MSFFKEQKLYRVEITKRCCVIDAVQCFFSGRGYLPESEVAKKEGFGFIPVGIKGSIIEKFGKKYFIVDENQEGLDLFLPVGQGDCVMIPYDKIKDCYRILEE